MQELMAVACFLTYLVRQKFSYTLSLYTLSKIL
jgi:hypothetical protein